MKSKSMQKGKNKFSNSKMPAIGWTFALILLALAIIYLSPLLMPHARAIDDLGRGYVASPEFRPIREAVHQDFENYFTLRLLLSSINIVLVIYLLYVYVKDFLRFKSGFELGLVAFLFSFLLYALSSLPLLDFLFGFKPMPGIFSFIPMLFSAIGLVIFVKLSNE